MEKRDFRLHDATKKFVRPVHSPTELRERVSVLRKPNIPLPSHLPGIESKPKRDQTVA